MAAATSDRVASRAMGERADWLGAWKAAAPVTKRVVSASFIVLAFVIEEWDRASAAAPKNFCAGGIVRWRRAPHP